MVTLTKEQVKELAALNPETRQFLEERYPEAFKKDVIDLTSVRNSGNTALSISSNLGRRLLVQLNNSPYHLYQNQSLLVGPGLDAEVVNSLNDKLIIFTQRS